MRVDSVQRHTDASTLADRRNAQAADAGAQRGLRFFSDMETLVGLPGDPGALTTRIANFEASLVSAASMPNAHERLRSVSQAAATLAQGLNEVSVGLQRARKQADHSISHLVESLNTNLLKTERLNHEIAAAKVKGHDTASLLDQRQRVLDSIAEVVPVRLMRRDHGVVALYSAGGMALVDGSAAKLSFGPANEITPEMTMSGGSLSGLSVNGVSVNTAQGGALGSGLLETEFAIRDEIAVSLQTDLDAIARDLVTRFQDSSLDPTLVPGSVGLFTDADGAFVGPESTGLSNRISVNPLVDTSKTNELWRLRDGLGAVTEGAVSNATLLQAMSDKMAYATSLNGAATLGGVNSAHGFAIQLVSLIGGQRLSQEDSAAFSASRLTVLREQEMAEGVDSDQEMQRLLLIEQSYAANARVIQTVDELMETLLRI